jgi:acyl-coenzyme A synthetase/AMP-(fatty) acid ligase
MTLNFDGRTVSEWFRRTAAAGADREFLHVPAEACRHYADSALTLTYGQAAAQVALLAEQLRKAGYRPGHRVALALDNRPQFFIHFLALAQLGMSVVPLNGSMSAAELSYVIGHADIALAVTHSGHAAHVRAALPESIPLHVIVDGGRAVANHGQVIADDAQAYAAPAAPPTAAADELALLYTSGTTGLPKGCILSGTASELMHVLAGHHRVTTRTESGTQPGISHLHLCRSAHHHDLFGWCMPVPRDHTAGRAFQ